MGANFFDTARADEFVELLRARLPDKIFRHCLSVTEFMLAFHEQAGIGREQAVEAGLLHDLCKAMKPAELKAVVEARGLELTERQLVSPALLHGPVAAAECKSELGIADPEVLDAIFWHSTGRPNWSAVGLSLYLADYAEPLRTRNETAEARDLLREEGFRAAVIFAAKTKLAYIAREFALDPVSLAFGEWVAGEWDV
ncbi:MAG: bis(5'-nucleosyl)-tetraphosphatase (symmetrical) YqeK [Candidatus Hydrogenedentes bacterium]|nr:bis(5'-nucleosyl)-tetraphosphatase (symmetrical) YqeK [Candidatus Hydrogenedentota bacterium]